MGPLRIRVDVQRSGATGIGEAFRSSEPCREKESMNSDPNPLLYGDLAVMMIVDTGMMILGGTSK